MVTLTSKPFYPPYIKPPPKPLSTFQYFKTVLSNALLSIPEPVYDEPIYSTRSFPPIVYVTDPNLVKEVLVDRQEEFEKEPVARRLLKPLIGDGILMAEGQSWRQQRRMAAPLFRHGEILRYIPSMARATDSLTNQWRSLAPGSLLKIDEEMIKVTYDVISHTILAGGGSGVGEAVIQGRNDYQEGINWWFVYSLFKLPHSLPRPKGRPMRAQEKRLRSAVAELIADRRKATDDR
ncbi:MAG: cytochrome P450, partial [Desulfobulbia bacterium]